MTTEQEIDRSADEPQAENEDSLRDALRLSLIPGIGPRLFGDLVARFGSPAAVLRAPPNALRDVEGIGQKLVRAIVSADSYDEVDKLLELCHENEIEILTRSNPKYPKPLLQIFDPPNILFLCGQILPADAMSIAIVGSRHATHYGLAQAEKLARALSLAGLTIVSGMARGIDQAAHHGALAAGGRTISVLGSGLLNIYPPEHAGLAKEIKQHGAILSEFHPLTAPKSGAFPQRNRILTGLSLGVIIVEAAFKSGALISAHLAAEQGREVFAVPGRVDSRLSRGCHRLIRDGAKLVEAADDVLEELGPLFKPVRVDDQQIVRHPAELKLNDQETKVLQAIDAQPTDIDTIVAKSGLPISRVLSTISVLEIRHLLRRISGNSVARI